MERRNASHLSAIKAFYKGAGVALRGAISLMKYTISPGAAIGGLYALHSYVVSHNVDVLMSLVLYTAVTVTFQPIFIYWKIIEFIGESYSLQSSERRLGYIKPKCVNLEVVSYRDVGRTRYIEVRCRLGYMTSYGCPSNCPGYRGPTLGAAALVGAMLGGGIGLLVLGGPLGALAGALLGIALGLTYETTRTLTRFEQLVQEARSRGMEVIVIVKRQ